MADINELMNRFRLASRELFNHFFRVPDPYKGDDGWTLKQRFLEVQAILFQKLVTEPASLPNTKYGDAQVGVLVKLRSDANVPIMLNREIDSGYWDYAVREATPDARLSFLCFFDWDQLDYQDNRYVRVRVESWPSHPETVGKHALIESQYVRFTMA